MPMASKATPVHSPWTFFALAYGLAIPFLLLGAVTGRSLMPGLPIAALMVVCPVLAALILSWRAGGGAPATALLGRALDVARIRRPAWWFPTLLLMPGVAVAQYAVTRLIDPSVPQPHLALGQTLSLSALFIVAALAEELGWSGYALPALQDRFGVWRASLILGAAWAVFHYVPLAQAHRSAAWIAWWTLGTLASRVIMVWLYNNTGGSVFAAAAFHASQNLGWQLFPVRGSYWQPWIFGPIAAVVALFVAVLWWRRTFAGRGVS